MDSLQKWLSATIYRDKYVNIFSQIKYCLFN